MVSKKRSSPLINSSMSLRKAISLKKVSSNKIILKKIELS